MSYDIETSICTGLLATAVEEDLQRLYKNIFSSALLLQIGGMLKNSYAYIVRKNGIVTNLLLFRYESGVVNVLNQGIFLSEEEIEIFSREIFKVYKSVTAISFVAVQTDVKELSWHFQQFNCLEDIVVPLPNSNELYFSKLGKQLQTDLRRYRKKIAADFPGFRFAVYEKADVDERKILDIISLSNLRIADKSQISSHTDNATQQLIALVKTYGMVVVAQIDDRICGGVICTHYGGNFFMHVIAHDPLYDKYRLGKICCFFSICEAIQRRASEYHMLWGKYEYKFRFLGVQRDLYRIVIYRSFAHMPLNFEIFLRTFGRGYARRVKQWFQADVRKNSRISKLIVWIIGVISQKVV